ncbi:hypothetical protein COT64_02300 [Candidatus Shapirobacteria bacterium CG09_land_8_20_14_0_10_39_12]|uniref:DUF4349 domain-containing protein n=1 Tax=Candidatus Shapirobacteria bacterium CG09_land_8_20_14_0_10_39_12 TaxID=1974885 RepID=A0A2H0WPD0_9BACT|nr:MAG: hypothetical protein COT64_02300 [Candidatus Shapirobacteria bacterium CG09_land_8_20_14_0_10_39_12]
MIGWIKRNKLASVIFLIVAYFLTKQYFGVRPLSLRSPSNYGIGGAPESASLKSMGSVSSLPLPSDNYAPTTTTDRMVVQESNLSLVVKDVRESSDKVIEHAKSIGGYMVSSSLSQPEEAPYAYVVLRIPADKLKATVDYFRSLSLKVSSENLLGTDVTDQYTDLNAHLETLNQTKSKFEEILRKAIEVQDILTVQREMISLQSQIDSIKGQQLYLEKTAQLAKISLHLSTDEFSLPYAPSGKFRPAVIFKQAVRSMVSLLRWLAKVLIWVGVFSVLWIPALLVVRYSKKRKKTS